MITLAALRERFALDTTFGGHGATPGLARALEAIGWRAVRDPSPEQLADELVYLVAACVDGQYDVSTLAHSIAELLRHAGPMLDGGLPPTEAYLPAAEELLQRYTRDDATDRRIAFDE
ncbi:MAG: hypothetical protein IT353_02650 [Gemmatimonadaceae bacterium]|nr:hypothetical protein [Gemmatimonadaceae bacterium]